MAKKKFWGGMLAVVLVFGLVLTGCGDSDSGDPTSPPGKENPGTDNSGTDNPGTNKPAADDPGTDNPGNDEPGTDKPGTDNPGTDNPSTDDPGTETPSVSNPSKPTGVKATAATSYIRITWNSVAGATKYRLYAAKTSYGSGLDVGNYFKEVTSTSYNDTYPEAGETWYYKVSAVNSAGEGPQSSVVSAKITSSTGGDSPTINTPNTPYGSPVIKNKTSNGWTVEWNASLNATGYKLYRKSNLSSNWGLAYSGSSTSFTDTGLTSGVTYYYRVTATNTAGESDYSGEKSIMF